MYRTLSAGARACSRVSSSRPPQPGMMAQEVSHPHTQFGTIHGFREKVLGSRAEPEHPGLAIVQGGDHDDGNVLGGEVCHTRHGVLARKMLSRRSPSSRRSSAAEAPSRLRLRPIASRSAAGRWTPEALK